MNMLRLLNPADDVVPELPASAMAHHNSGVLVVETQVEDTTAARSLMMLGYKDGDGDETSPNPRAHQAQAARSPMLLPAYATSFHMSPVASKTAAQAPTPSVWAPSYGLGDDAELPAPAPLRRRLSSISSMLNELELPSSCDLVSPSSSPPASAPARPDYCSVTGCLRRPSPQNQGKCTVHKGMKLCQIDGCFRPVQSRGCCKSHGGGARCKYPECSKGAISKGRCRTHGGGTRCAVPECLKWAQRFGCCVRHSKAVTPKPQLL